MTKVPMTVTGHKKLHNELERLKRDERPKIIKAIEEARKHGDLRENAEYHAAKEMQAFTEGKIRDIESKLSHAQVIDVTKLADKETVVFGATVHLNDLDNDQEVVYQIVGDDEADVKDGKISVGSPVARALIGKKEGDEIELLVKGGKVSYEIQKIEYV